MLKILTKKKPLRNLGEAKVDTTPLKEGSYWLPPLWITHVADTTHLETKPLNTSTLIRLMKRVKGIFSTR
jgi:hypothetical protein